ncbi:hypothetical protein [Corynebacterium matruchotii]|uniref:Prolipoprotein LppL n=1 Tax=Corynebacterium matruchotii ATCC 33806 TaxID=566549 RepID=C0E398_9CORY|nr:hypothetical protein [Corynebacterium matruchotii]EEG27032.1 hypothetical protein CORMATOL_01461 [Corynebacterium matruchotii ATCC 33806]
MMGVVLTACTPPSVQEKLPTAMGNATPAPSPAIVDAPAGEVISLPEQLAKVTKLDHIGEIIAVRARNVVGVGTVDQLRAGRLVMVPVDAACGDISAAPASHEFVLGCPDGVYGIPTSVANTADDAGGAGDAAGEEGDGGETAELPTANPVLLQATDQPVTAAVKTTSGMIFAGSSDREDVDVYQDGEKTTIRVEDPTDAMIAVPVSGGEDSVYRINRRTTIIQNINVADKSAGAVLRVGLGVGTITPGAEGMALATDTIGKQFGVYLTHDVIRLHQTTPTTGAPWAIAWDDNRQQVWVATTDDNKIRRYQLGSGQGEELEAYNSIENTQSLVALPDGTILAASATGTDVQVITP